MSAPIAAATRFHATPGPIGISKPSNGCSAPCSIVRIATPAKRKHRSRSTRRNGAAARIKPDPTKNRSEEHTSELQSLMRISYAVFCLKKKNHKKELNNYRANIKQNTSTQPKQTY